MKTVAQIIEHYNKRNKTIFYKIEVEVKKNDKISMYENYYDVSQVSFFGDMLCFYGKCAGSDIERYIRIDNADIIRSEV
jgi:hypothetical protein